MSLLSPRSSFTRRLAIAAVAGALAGAVAVTPAAANDDWGDGPGVSNSSGGNGSGGNGRGDDNGSGGNGGNGQDARGDDNGSGGNGGNGRRDDNGMGGNGGEQGRYKGVVTARSLALRSKPTRGSHVIRYAHRGDVVHIHCKIPGDRVDGNPLWYLLTDGTWAWGAARYIDNIGSAPRWC
ncbi:SH3 domain-containing protein [Streptomyces poriticola]|uniref:SH3 domain-containing protein n=1 Tax=Streptomyces poriticola TaxID=3120506 RepID=UPI002FCE2E69